MFSFLNKTICCFRSWPLLFMRLILAYGFYGPAMKKFADFQNGFSSLVPWFKTLGIPYPLINAYMVTGFEVAGVGFLLLGFLTRLITIPLMVIMGVAIYTVHWANGFAVANNGFEIPLYFFVMLFTLFVFGPGRFSLDSMMTKKKEVAPEPES